LTVFNGTAKNESKLTQTDWLTDEFARPDAADPTTRSRYRFRSRERGLGRFALEDPAPGETPEQRQMEIEFQNTFRREVNLWKAVWEDPKRNVDQTIEAPNTGDYLMSAPIEGEANNEVESLGFLNLTYGLPVADPNPTLNGRSRFPLPWLTFNDHAFSSMMELLQVPASSPSRLTHEFYTAEIPEACQRPTPPLNLFTFTREVTKEREPYFAFYGAYGHLLNFFQQPVSGTHLGTPEFSRLFDWVEIPSPYARSRTWYNGAEFDRKVPGFSPPFHYFSAFRDPGKININTIFDAVVWQAVSPQVWRADFDDLVRSRQGFSTSSSSTVFPGELPSMFANPFRSAASASMMPLVTHPGTVPHILRVAPVEATLLRSNSTLGGRNNRPLFRFASGNDHNDSDANSHFRFQTIERLSNLVTTQSNVYAVWITVGYFEVEVNRNQWTNDVDLQHHDGYRLGPELGLDAGQVQRHRGFYIIDRSIPVGFEPGKDHNVEKTIVLKRRLD
jgi:hypothetical protein